MYRIFKELPDSPLELIDYIFRNVFVKHGYAIREDQIRLSKKIYEGIGKKKIFICEAGVGLGKTYAYLTAALVDRIYRMHQKELKEKQSSFGTLPQVPGIVITTSSIELQHALSMRYIAELSSMLVAEGLLPRTVRCVVRKGKEHYLCKLRLLSYFKSMEQREEHDQYRILSELNAHPDRIDLDMVENISEKTMSRINIPAFCGNGCRYYTDCAYIRYREQAKRMDYDIQITNHNYFLVSESMRRENGKGLLTSYRFLIVDEVHKLEEAAMQINSVCLHSRLFSGFAKICRQALYGQEKKEWELLQVLDDMVKNNSRLFWYFRRKRMLDSIYRMPYAARNLLRALHSDLQKVRFLGKDLIEHNIMIARSLSQLESCLEAFVSDDGYYYEYADGEKESFLTAFPSDSSAALSGLWKDYSPKLLISGTLEAQGSFFYFKKRNGLEKMLSVRIMEAQYASAFSYEHQARLYISEHIPMKSLTSEEYLSKLSDEIGSLIEASKGHAAVLFTSYRLMMEVCRRMEKRLPYPIFCTSKEDKTVVSRFKSSGNGVLLATGSFWEGIDCPGEILSMLIIPVLPFPVPDLAGEMRKKTYENLTDYISMEVTPAMLVKLRQGAGRLIRTETDRGVLAILDERASKSGKYRRVVTEALKDYPIVGSVEEAACFLSGKGVIECVTGNVFSSQR